MPETLLDVLRLVTPWEASSSQAMEAACHFAIAEVPRPMPPLTLDMPRNYLLSLVEARNNALRDAGAFVDAH